MGTAPPAHRARKRKRSMGLRRSKRKGKKRTFPRRKKRTWRTNRWRTLRRRKRMGHSNMENGLG